MTEQAVVSVPDTMPEPGTTRATTVLADEINEEHRLARQSADSAIEHAIRCGELLLARKGAVNHGEFLPWVKSYCDFSEDSAQAYMRLARQKPSALGFSSIRQALGWERETRERPVFREPRPLPEAGYFNLVLADPPWRYEHVKTESRAIENQYPTMGLAEIAALKVPAADDCVLFLWATSPKLAEAIGVIAGWGFTYRTCAVWDKEVIGMGYYFRQQHELLLVATRGEPGPPQEDSRLSSVIRSRRGKHSAKPEIVYEILERMYPHAARLELFARNQREGWTSWGNQLAA